MDKRYSILQKNFDRCYICSKRNNLHIHEVFYGSANRKLSIQYGCCVKLCAEHHNMSNYSVHLNGGLDLKIKKEMQMKFEEVYKDLDFIKIFGKSWIT